MRFVGTAGGLLRTAAREAVLLTPVAVLGDDAAAVLAAIDAALAGPDPERELRQCDRAPRGGAPARGARRRTVARGE